MSDETCNVCGQPSRYETHGPAGCVIRLRTALAAATARAERAERLVADQHDLLGAMKAERDEARALLREAHAWVWAVCDRDADIVRDLRARIEAHLEGQ